MIHTFAHNVSQLCYMKETVNHVDKSHRGEVVSNVLLKIRVNGVKVTQVWLADRLKISRRTLINWLDKADLSIENIRQIGRVVKHDFSNEFPEFKEELVWTLAEEAALLDTPDLREQIDRIKLDRDRYKDQYIGLLERYNQLQEEFYKLKLKAK